MSMIFNGKPVGTAAGKIKKASASAALMFFFIMLLTIGVSAAEVNEIKLEANGSEASLELYFPQAVAEGIASMQVSVSVTANSDGVDLEFIPDSGLAAKIVESRYQSGTGTLNIYLAGTEALFSYSEFTKVGRVKVTASGSNAASASVEVVKDSVKFVRSGELVSPDSDTDYPAPVTLTALGQSSSGTVDPVYPDYPAGNYFPNIIVSTGDNNDRGNTDRNDRYDADETRRPVQNDSGTGSDSDVKLEEQDTVGENLNPPDTLPLLDALSRAGGYRKTDYTESSYDDLKEAVDKANELIADPSATQDEIDEALLNIENAIGMLKLRNDIPSGAEGYGENNGAGIDGNSFFGENDGDDLGNDEYGQGGQSPYGNAEQSGSNGGAQASQNGDVVNASDEAQPVYNADDPFLKTEGSGKNTVLWIIVVAAAAAVAAVAAIIVLKKSNKTNDANEKHFKN